jgi:hypothetical protein
MGEEERRIEKIELNEEERGKRKRRDLDMLNNK